MHQRKADVEVFMVMAPEDGGCEWADIVASNKREAFVL